MKIQKKKLGGGSGWRGGGRVWGVGMDVNEELKFFVKIQKEKKNWGGGGPGGSGWGGQGGCERRIEVFLKIKEKKLGGGVGGCRVGGDQGGCE